MLALASECAIPLRTGEGDHPQDGGAASAVSPTEAEAGMAEMSRVYNEGGRELYIRSGGPGAGLSD